MGAKRRNGRRSLQLAMMMRRGYGFIAALLLICSMAFGQTALVNQVEDALRAGAAARSTIRAISSSRAACGNCSRRQISSAPAA